MTFDSRAGGATGRTASTSAASPSVCCCRSSSSSSGHEWVRLCAASRGGPGAGKAVCYVYEGSTASIVGSDLSAARRARPARGRNWQLQSESNFPCRAGRNQFAARPSVSLRTSTTRPAQYSCNRPLAKRLRPQQPLITTVKNRGVASSTRARRWRLLPNKAPSTPSTRRAPSSRRSAATSRKPRRRPTRSSRLHAGGHYPPPQESLPDHDLARPRP